MDTVTMEKSTNLMPKLVMIRGLPGSGKSYLVAKLVELMGDIVEVLDPDATEYSNAEYVSFSKKLLSQGVDVNLHPYRYLRSKAYQGIVSDKIIIWNQAFTNLDLLDRTIKNLQAHANENAKKLSVLVVEVDIDQDIAKSRIADREVRGGHGVSEEAFARFVHDYSSFSEYKYTTISINGAEDVSVNAILIATEIKKL